jgi:Uma2 family endonuclease
VKEAPVATATTTRWETIEDLVEQLGGIPLRRIRMTPTPGTATETDLLEAEGRYHSLFELVDGVLVEKAIGYRESILAAALGGILLDFVGPRNLGVVSGPDGMVRLFPGLVRGPDVAYATWDCFPDRRIPDEPIPTLAPDLVVEVLSESNTVREMERKRGEYFSQGVSVVWEIDPETRTATVYKADGTVIELTESDRLDGGDVLPGFSLELRELFAELDRHG